MSTRPDRVRYFLLSFFILLTCALPQTAFAELATTDTSLLPSAPLIVTAYQTSLAGNDIRFIEVYNSSDELVDLSSWEIFDAVNTRSLQIGTTHAGFIQPDTHVVLARAGEVAGASYEISGWITSEGIPATTKIMTTLQLLHDGYRSTDLTLKANGTEQIRNFGVSSYLTSFTEGSTRSLFDDGLYIAPEAPLGIEVSEVYAYASDCSPLDESVLCGDYIELHNTTNSEIDLTDLVVRIDSNSSSRAVSNTFSLEGILAPGAYLAIAQTDGGDRVSLTNSGGYVWLEDAWDTRVYGEFMSQWPSFSSEEQGIAYMRDTTGSWGWTTMPTPGIANVMHAPVPVIAECSEGKYRNPETGRCRTIEEAVSELAACEEGYERNPTTNRCRKVILVSSTALTPCLEGQERNPATNRCRSIASAVAELMPCDEGYERNPATNRCRKIQASDIPSVPFAVEPIAADAPVWQWWIGGAIGASLAGYAVWEWRSELASIWARILKRRP